MLKENIFVDYIILPLFLHSYLPLEICLQKFYLMLIFEKFHTSSHKKAKTSGSIEFACPRGNCGKRFDGDTGLQKHLDMHDNILYRCHFCPWTGVGTLSHLIVNHFNTHFGFRAFACSFCPAKFYQKVTRKQHEREQHLQIKRKSKCGSCDFETEYEGEYKRHMKICAKRKL